MLTVATLFLLFIPSVVTHSNGAPPHQCANMKPSHRGISAQTTQAPYIVFFNSSTYSPHQAINVTLAGMNGTTFRGFLIEPRGVNTSTKNTTYGSFIDIPTADAKNPCNMNAGLTHTSPSDKSSITFTWKAPSLNVGDIVFVYTVVKTEPVFWVQLHSPTLTFLNSSASDNSPTTTSGTTQLVVQSRQCGVSVHCYPADVDCSTNCDFSIMWLASAYPDSILFTLKKKTTLPEYYIAIGFSKDSEMGDDSVAACISTNGVVNVTTSYNVDNENNLLDDPKFGLTLTNGSYRDAVLSCSFDRKVSARVAGNISYSSQFFDLAKEYYLLVAHGPASGGRLMKHNAAQISANKINFLNFSTINVSNALPTQPSTGMLQKDKECGVSLGCFHDCTTDNTCSFMLTWADNGDNIDMTLTCKRSLNEYCAIGLSSDNEMGDDSVIQCVPYDNTTSVYLSYNTGRSNQILPDSQIGLTNIATSYTDGILRCKFSRKKTAALASTSTGRKKRATPVDAMKYKDLNSDWILMLAYGVSSSGGKINRHKATPTVSTQKADFQSFEDISGNTIVNTVVKAHGILMVVAWLLFATTGIFMARFYKTVWPQGMEWLGNKRWFVVHRACMVLALLLTAAAFIMIFVNVGGYAEIDGTTFKKSHPILGIIIMGLAIVNPIMSIFRPGPGTPNRPIFNWAHRSVGVVAHVLSVVNIFSGVLLAEAKVSNDALIPLWIFVGWFSLLELILFTYDYMASRTKKHEFYEMKNVDSDNVKPEGKVHKSKVILLVIHLVALLALTVAVCVIIGQTTL